MLGTTKDASTAAFLADQDEETQLLGEATDAEDDSATALSDPLLSSHAFDPSQTLAQMRQQWVNERCAPTLLPYPSDLVRKVLSLIEAQVPFHAFSRPV